MVGWRKEAVAEFASGTGRLDAESLLEVLSHRHGAQDVQEGEGAVRPVFAIQAAMGKAADPRDGLKW